MRPSRDTILMEIAKLMAQRSTCTRKNVGALAAKEGRVLVTGYNGAPSGLPHCTELGGCPLDENGGCSNSVHAEANLIAFAAKYGISLQGAVVYTTCSPCLNCARLLINAGIVEVIYSEEYRDPGGLELLKRAGVKVRLFQDEQRVDSKAYIKYVKDVIEI